MTTTMLAVEEGPRVYGELEGLVSQEPYTPLNYSQTLRVIGQVLESLKAESFDIICYRNCYLVRCLTRERENELRGLSRFLRASKEENPPPIGPDERPSMNVEVLYTPEDIQRLDQQAKSR